MKKKIFLFSCLFFSVVSLHAQTWNGNTSTDWNTATNWSTNAVPGPANSVIIPNTVNKPVLASNVTITGFTMSAGSELNFNSYTLTATGAFDINGGTLNNTHVASDITITIEGTGSKYIRSGTVNDHITINYNGTTGGFYEGFGTANTFNGNTIFNIGGAALFYTSYSLASTFNGNVTVNRTIAGSTYIFNNGFTALNGNLSYTNNAGGASYINNSAVACPVIGGTVNITATGGGNPLFEMNYIRNTTGGGSVSVQNSGATTFYKDTLVVNSFDVNGFTGGGTDDFHQNSITGTISISDNAANTGSIYLRKNTFTGNTTIGCNSAAPLFEAFSTAGNNTYNGNTAFNLAGTAIINICYSLPSAFNGDLTINRTVAGATYIVSQGFTALTGSFGYTNNAGGATYINNSNTPCPVIGGMVNITATGAGNPIFEMNYIRNTIGGGSVSVQNSGTTTFYKDTLVVNSFNVNGFTGGGIDDFHQNSITGTINISDGAANTGSIYFRKNTFNGNTTIGCNSAASLFEAFSTAGNNTYNGNTAFNLAGIATINICYSLPSAFNGDLTINRTVAGATYIVSQGFTALTGNFSYTNNAGGDTYINNSAVACPVIGGIVNITATGVGNPVFEMNYIRNTTGGGAVSVQNSGTTTFYKDTLVVNSFDVNGFTGGGTDDFHQNSITGTVNISDGPVNTGSIYLRKNTINGDFTYTQNSAAAVFESYSAGGSDTYNGNASFTRNAGTINMANGGITYFNKDLILNADAGLIIGNALQFDGTTDAVIEQLTTLPITIPTLIMNKTGGARLTLNDSVTVTNTATFTSGHIYSSSGKELIFPDNINHTGASVNSHVIGPVTKIGNDVFTFPIGAPVSYNPVTMSAPVGVTSRFMAEYKNQNPTIDGYNTAAKAGSFGAALISNMGYWDVQRIIGATNVTLTLGFNSNPYEQYPVLGNLKVAHWNGAQWDDHGNGGTTGTSASGTVVNSVAITSFSPFTIAGVNPTYFFVGGQPGPGPDGSPIKLKGTGGWPGYTVRELPGGSYTADSIFLKPNGSTTSFRLKDLYGVEKDTTITAPASPASYISANGNGAVNFVGWRHFVYMLNGGGQMMGAIRDNDLTPGNTTMNTYFSTANVATAPNGGIFLKRSFKITSQFAPAGTKRVRLYISKTEFTDLVAADPTSFPSGINSLTITKYTGPMEDSLFSPIPGGNAVIIPNGDITIVDLGAMYSLDIDISGFSGFYIGGNNSNLNVCSGSTISIPSNISGATYQWQADDGSGFVNISNGGAYIGVGTKTLTITNAPGNLYGYKFRCVVNGVTFSQEYTLKFNALWQGNVSNVWENTANWSCGVLPDVFTDVVLNAGKPNYPLVNSNTSVRSLTANPGATITVKTGFTLTIIK